MQRQAHRRTLIQNKILLRSQNNGEICLQHYTHQRDQGGGGGVIMIALISACGQRMVLQGILVSRNPTTIPLYDSV